MDWNWTDCQEADSGGRENQVKETDPLTQEAPVTREEALISKMQDLNREICFSFTKFQTSQFSAITRIKSGRKVHTDQ